MIGYLRSTPTPTPSSAPHHTTPHPFSYALSLLTRASLTLTFPTLAPIIPRHGVPIALALSPFHYNRPSICFAVLPNRSDFPLLPQGGGVFRDYCLKLPSPPIGKVRSESERAVASWLPA
ncbi:hypothetical protein VNO77_24984 [Canavalia gladiata]|uniref:Uncharacterized protein n=1 Tax=Canavalia gladiata TaxID=3824 RepID=A0AAN9QD77_CANGL